VHLLADRGEMTVGELAQALVISQPSVSQTLRSLQSAKWVSEKLDPRDARRRIQRLTKAGLAFVDKLRPIWLALMQAARDLDGEAIVKDASDRALALPDAIPHENSELHAIRLEPALPQRTAALLQRKGAYRSAATSAFVGVTMLVAHPPTCVKRRKA
jgi:DNA-binding MarR family transcriptional regulator